MLRLTIVVLLALTVAAPAAGAATIQASLKPAFQADLTNTLKLQAGFGNPTFTRATIATVQDWEGLIKNVLSGEARFTGARRVGNLVTGNSENYTGWTNYGSPTSVTLDTSDYPAGTSKSTVISNDAVYEGKTVGSVFVVGKMYRASIWAKGSAGGEFIMFTDGLGTGGSVAVTTSWARYSILFTAANSSGAVLVSQAGAATVKFSGVLWEEVTGQSNTNPSEYVSCGVLAAPYHGAGVDCVKYFNTLNGNTVTSNVVGEASGAKITSAVFGASSAATDATGPLGYLAEGARTNLALQSQTLGTTWTQEGGAINEDQIASPDGTVTADKFTLSATTNRHRVYQIASSGVAGTTNVASVYVKAGTAGWFSISDASAGIFYAKFDAVNGVVGATGGANFQSASITPLPNGWYRIAMVYSTAANPNTINFALGDTQAHVTDANSTWTAAGTETGYFWGAQIEAASFASSYIPTTAASVARAGDILTYPTYGNTGEGAFSLYLEMNRKDNTSASFPQKTPIMIGSYASNAMINFGGYSATSGALLVNFGSTWDVAAIPFTIQYNTLTKIALRLASSLTTFSTYKDGVKGNDVVSPNAKSANWAGSPSLIYIANIGSSDSDQNITVRNVKIWKKALTDTQLKTMTNTSTATARAAVPQTTTKAPTKTGLVGHWTFNEGTGTRANDSSGLGNTGTLIDSPTWTTGKLGKALSFNGTTSYVNAGTQSITGSFTLSCWVKPNVVNTYQRCLEKGMYSTGWLLGISNAGKADFTTGNGATYRQLVGLTTLSANRWHHIAGVYNASTQTMTIYLNGVADNTPLDITGFAIGNTGDAVQIGAELSASYLFNGTLDDVRLYNRALSAAEVAALYKSTAVVVNASTNTAGGSLTSGLIGLWSFDGKDVNWGTGTAFDRSGAGNNGSLINMSTSTSPAIGKIGQALKFNGTTNYVSVASSPSNDIGSGDYSISVWYYSSRNMTSNDNILGKGVAFNGGSTGMGLRSRNSGSSIEFCLNGGSGTCPRIGGSTLTNSWNHVVVVVSRTNTLTTLYISGAPAGTMVYAPTYTDTFDFSIGVGENGFFPSKIDDVRIYSRALSATEVKALYNLGR